MQNKAKLRKIKIGAIVALIILAVGTGLVLWIHERNIDVASRTESKCSSYPGGLPVWPESLTAFTDRSYGVVVGTVLNPNDSLPQVDGNLARQLRVTDVLKGQVLHKGDVLRLCGNTGPINFADGNYTVLVFLSGRNQNLWIPVQGDVGIIPQDSDGRFRRDWADDSKTSATVDELKQLIK